MHQLLEFGKLWQAGQTPVLAMVERWDTNTETKRKLLIIGLALLLVSCLPLGAFATYPQLTVSGLDARHERACSPMMPTVTTLYPVSIATVPALPVSLR